MKSAVLQRALLAGILATAFPGPVLAVVAARTPAPTTTPRLAVSPAQTAAAAQTQRLANLKSKGTAEIDRRAANLTSALEKLTASTRLTATDKAALTKQVQDSHAGLAALKTKLAAETDLAAARADVKSIVDGYRVYVLLLPKVRMVASADRFAVVEGNLAALHDALEAKVPTSARPADGGTALQGKLDDMKLKIDAARSRTNGIVAKLLALQPTDYNANHAVLTSYRDAMKASQTDLKAARDDARSVADSLKTTK